MSGADRKIKLTRTRRFFEIQQELDADDVVFERRPTHESKRDEETLPLPISVPERREAGFEWPPLRPKKPQPVIEGLKPCVCCYATMHRCDGLKPTCTPCTRDGYSCFYSRLGGGGSGYVLGDEEEGSGEDRWVEEARRQARLGSGFAKVDSRRWGSGGED